jgi:hypothetical protein
VREFDCINLGTLLKDAHLPGIHHSISRMHFVQPGQELFGKTNKPQPLRGGQHLTYSLLTLGYHGYEKTEYCKAVMKTVPQPPSAAFEILGFGDNIKLLEKCVTPLFSS